MGRPAEVSFKYTAKDPSGATSNTATGTITITGVNDAPTVAAITADAQEDGPPVILAAVGDESTATTMSQASPTRSSASCRGEMARSPTTATAPSPTTRAASSNIWPKAKPPRSFFAYKATDKHGATSDFAHGTITVTGVNDAPTAVDLAFTTSEDGPVLIEALAGDDIDSDDDPTSLSYTIASLPGKGR